MTKLNKDIKAEWVRRLREEGRPQVSSDLHTSKGQCCLGVLSEMAFEQGVVERTAVPDEDNLNYFKYDNSVATMSPKVAAWAGFHLHDEIGDIKTRNVSLNNGSSVYITSLAGANDAGMTFAQIADIVEAEL